MPVDVLMPALSPTMEQGKLSKWLKKEGDRIKSGDILAEIETDKATMEVEAVDEGILARIMIADGTENVAVNTVIAVIAAEGEDVSAAPAANLASVAPAAISPAAESVVDIAGAPPEAKQPLPSMTIPAAPKSHDASAEYPAGTEMVMKIVRAHV